MKPLAELLELLSQQPDYTLEGYTEEDGIDEHRCTSCRVADSPTFYCDTPEEAVHRALVAAGVIEEESK